MSLVLILSFAAQTVQTLAGPNEAARPATAWSCAFEDAAGSKFRLSAMFPEAPAGWLPNDDLPTAIEGDGPEIFRGRQGVRSFGDKNGAREYQVSLAAPGGVRYNLNFAFTADGGKAGITRYTPVGDRGRLEDFATGTCNADFTPQTDEQAAR